MVQNWSGLDISACGETSECSIDREEQAPARAGEKRKAMMLVEALRRFVLGIYNHCEHTHLRPRGALQGIRQQNAAETKPLLSEGNSEPAKQSRRNHWVAWQFLNELGGKGIQGDAGGAQGVVSGDLSRIVADSDKTGSDPAPDIVGRVRLKISVKRGGATHESSSVERVGEQFNTK